MRVESCKEVGILLSKRLDGELTLKERWRLMMHLLICNICRKLGKQLKEQQRLAQSADAHLPALPPASKERIVTAMKDRE